MTRRLNEALKKQKKSTKQETLKIYGLLGLPIGGSKRVEVPNRNAYVYVRLRNNTSEVIQAFNNKVAPAYNLPVIVEREGNRYSVVSVDTQRYENNWNSFAPYLPRHGNTHSFDPDTGGGGDIVFVHGRQFIPALIFPSGSDGGPNAILAPYTLKRENNSWMYVGNTGTPSFLPYVPTGSNAVMVLVYLDAPSGNPYLIVGSGSYFPNSLTGTSSVAPYIPTLPNPSTQIPLAAVRLVTGTHSIDWPNIYDLRQYVHTVPTGTGGGAGSFTIQDEGVSQGTATTLNFVGPNVDASVAGSIARIFVTGSSGGGATSDGTYLRLDASNDPLTGKLSIQPTGTNTDGLFVQTMNDAYTADFEQRATGTATVTVPNLFLYRAPMGTSTPTFSAPLIEAEQEPGNGTISSSSPFIKYTYDGDDVFIIGREGGIDSDIVDVTGWFFSLIGNASVISGNHFGASGTNNTQPTVSILRDRYPGDSAGTVSGTALNILSSWPTAQTITNRLLRYMSNSIERVLIDPSAKSTGTMVKFDGDFTIDSGGHLLLLRNNGASKFIIGNSGYIEFRPDLIAPSKEANAGKIGYQLFDNYLDIVGAGTGSLNRTVQIYDDLRVLANTRTSGLTISGLPSVLIQTNSDGTAISGEAPLSSGTYGRVNAGWSEVTPRDGWVIAAERWTQTGNHSFTVSGNVTATYRKGTKIRYKEGGGYEYGVIASSSHAAGTTTVTLVTNTDYTMTTSFPTDRYLSYIENPEGFPTSFNYSITVSSTAGTITSYTVQQAIFTPMPGAKLKIDVQFTITNNGTGSGAVQFDAPATLISVSTGHGRENAATGAMLQAYTSGNNVIIFTYANGYPGGTNYVIYLSIIVAH